MFLDLFSLSNLLCGSPRPSAPLLRGLSGGQTKIGKHINSPKQLVYLGSQTLYPAFPTVRWVGYRNILSSHDFTLSFYSSFLM